MTIKKALPGISKGGMDDLRPKNSAANEARFLSNSKKIAPSFRRSPVQKKASSASPPMTPKALKGMGKSYQRKK